MVDPPQGIAPDVDGRGARRGVVVQAYRLGRRVRALRRNAATAAAAFRFSGQVFRSASPESVWANGGPFFFFFLKSENVCVSHLVQVELLRHVERGPSRELDVTA